MRSPSAAFAAFAGAASRIAGRPYTFLACVALVLVWAATGPLAHYSDTWQLIINTSTTIVTFLMVFLIQNTQNRDNAALQAKLDELIVHTIGARNELANAEELSEEELAEVKDHFREIARKGGTQDIDKGASPSKRGRSNKLSTNGRGPSRSRR